MTVTACLLNQKVCAVKINIHINCIDPTRGYLDQECHLLGSWLGAGALG